MLLILPHLGYFVLQISFGHFIMRVQGVQGIPKYIFGVFVMLYTILYIVLYKVYMSYGSELRSIDVNLRKAQLGISAVSLTICVKNVPVVGFFGKGFSNGTFWYLLVLYAKNTSHTNTTLDNEIRYVLPLMATLCYILNIEFEIQSKCKHNCLT